MFSWEIEELLNNKEYIITPKEYLHILQTSPQITSIKYEPYGDYFSIGTEDRYNWNFYIRKED